MIEAFVSEGNARLDQDVDFLWEGPARLSQTLMELEVRQHLGAERHERTLEPAGQYNGYRERQWDKWVGMIPLQVPVVWDRSYFPALLEPRRRAGGPYFSETLDLLGRLGKDAQTKRRMHSTLEVLLLQALALDAQAQQTQALQTLARALELAQPEAISASSSMKGPRC